MSKGNSQKSELKGDFQKAKTTKMATKSIKSNEERFVDVQIIIDNLKEEKNYEYLCQNDIENCVEHFLSQLDPEETDLVIHEFTEEIKLLNLTRHSGFEKFKNFQKFQRENEKRAYIIFLAENYHLIKSNVDDIQEEKSSVYFSKKYGNILKVSSQRASISSLTVANFLNSVVKEAFFSDFQRPRNNSAAESIDEDEEKRYSIKNPVEISSKLRRSMAERNSEKLEN